MTIDPWAHALAVRALGGGQAAYLAHGLHAGGTWVRRTGLGRNKSKTALGWLAALGDQIPSMLGFDPNPPKVVIDSIPPEWWRML